ASLQASSGSISAGGLTTFANGTISTGGSLTINVTPIISNTSSNVHINTTAGSLTIQNGTTTGNFTNAGTIVVSSTFSSNSGSGGFILLPSNVSITASGSLVTVFLQPSGNITVAPSSAPKPSVVTSAITAPAVSAAPVLNVSAQSAAS